MRKKIFEMVEPSEGIDKITSIYDYFMMVVIIASLIPLAFKSEHTVFLIIDKICVAIFIVDYILRWITSDYKYNKKSVSSFIRYPFSLMAIIDLISILPSLTVINSGFKVLRVLRMIKAFRVFKALRYSRSVEIIVNVLKRSKESLVAVATLLHRNKEYTNRIIQVFRQQLFYIFIFAIAMLQYTVKMQENPLVYVAYS